MRGTQLLSALQNLYFFLEERNLLSELEQEPKDVLSLVNQHFTEKQTYVLLFGEDDEYFSEVGSLVFVSDEEREEFYDGLFPVRGWVQRIPEDRTLLISYKESNPSQNHQQQEQ